MMRLSTGIFFALLALNSSAKDLSERGYESTSLCAVNDKVYFSCTIKKAKIFSLCGKMEKAVLRRLYYRFGKRGSIELEYPEVDVKDRDTLSLFYYNHYTRFLANYYTITFHNHGYTYVLQDLRSYEKNERQTFSNIVVYDNSEQLNGITNSCTSNVISDLQPLTNIIPCDKESALGCEKGKEYLDGMGTYRRQHPYRQAESQPITAIWIATALRSSQ
jgi:hypothetical protein